MTFEEELKLKTEEADEIVMKFLPKEEGFQKTIFEACNYSVEAGGKRLRPILLLETYRLFDGHGRVAEPFAAAIEYIHTGSLVHDDLPCMDNDVLRRGKTTTWKQYGEDMGTLAGDALFIYAFETAAKALNLNTSAQNVTRAIGVLAEKAGVYGMMGGQTVDVEMTGKPLNEEQLRFIYELKTAALIEASMVCGAVLADASAEDIKAVEQIARQVGLAFQIRDDILGVTSTREKLGKSINIDEKNNKTTYVTLFGIDAAKEKVEELSRQAAEGMNSLSGENRFLNQLIDYLIRREY